ncbi:hypothetical protein CWM66_26575 [Kosakonia sp. H7A]|nr:hypothetical protein CWM66_26575 [Kosakonia sp. H7A]
MTNNDDLALKPVGKFMFVMNRWHHIWHGEAQYTEPRKPLVKLYSEETVNSLLAERTADKAENASLRQRVAELEGNLEVCQSDLCDTEDAMHLWAERAQTAEKRVAELEARTVSVKLPRYDLDMSDCDSCGQDCGADMSEEPDGDYVLLSDVIEKLAAAGIKLEVEE